MTQQQLSLGKVASLSPSQTTTASPSSYMAQLDSLRALAVFAVMFFHFFLSGQEGIIPLGDFGVTCFFVLSGFLITGILLRIRHNIEQGDDLKKQLKVFYIRRFLRIFPLFYAVVVVGTLLGVQGMHDSFPWNLTYTSNIHYALTKNWGGPDSHFWSLCVEEQFYLLWPLLILMVRKQYLLPVIIGTLLLAVCFRALVYSFNLDFFTKVLTISRLDALAIGSLLALFQQEKSTRFRAMAEQSSSRWVGAGLLMLVLSTSYLRFQYPLMGLVESVVLPWFCVWFVHRAAVGFKGWAGRIMESKVLTDCGKISYGLYVYHPFVYHLLPQLFRYFHLNYPEDVGSLTSLSVSVSVVVSALSWHAFEKPINNLKRHFNY